MTHSGSPVGICCARPHAGEQIPTAPGHKAAVGLGFQLGIMQAPDQRGLSIWPPSGADVSRWVEGELPWFLYFYSKKKRSLYVYKQHFWLMNNMAFLFPLSSANIRTLI